MKLRPPISTRTDTLFPCTTLCLATAVNRGGKAGTGTGHRKNIRIYRPLLRLYGQARGKLQHKHHWRFASDEGREWRYSQHQLCVPERWRHVHAGQADRKSAGMGKRVSVCVDLGGRRILKKKKENIKKYT